MEWERHHTDVEPNRRKLLLRELTRDDALRDVARVERRAAPTQVPPGERARATQVRPLEGIDVGVPEPRHDLWDVLVRERTRRGAAHAGLERLPIEREVDGSPQPRVVPEER